METIRCARCDATRDSTDNFCRTCGNEFDVSNSSHLPAVRPSALPSTRPRVLAVKSLPASFVGSMAVLAVGTGLEWAARRLVPSAAKAAGRAVIGQDRAAARQNKKATHLSDDVSIDEVLYIRKVQVRR